jgi:uncharacterized protein
MVKVRLTEDYKPKVIIMGFRGIGQVGYISINYLIEKLNMKRIGIVETTYAPPIVNVTETGLSYPIELYGYKELGIIKIEDIPINKIGAYILREIIKWLKTIKIDRLILIGGLVSSLKEGDDDTSRIVYNSYWREKVDMKYTQKDVRVLGPLAYALYYSEIYGVPALAILSYASSEQPIDPRGSYFALEALKKLVDIEVDTQELLERADEMEEKFAQFLQEIEEPKHKEMYT